MEMQNVNMEKLCRCCSTNCGKLFSIYDENKADKCLAYMLDQITAVKPKLADKLPNKACTLCIAEIHHLYNFKLKCKKSYKMLQQLFHYKPIYFNVDVKPMNIEEICRCCLTNDGKLFSLSINGKNTKGGCLAYMIDQMASVETELENKMPNKVCILCLGDIHRFCNLKLKCEQTNRMLQQMLCYNTNVHLGIPLNTPKINVNCHDDATSLPYQSSKTTSTSNNEVVSNFIRKRESDLFTNCSSYWNYIPTSETDFDNDSSILRNDIHNNDTDNDVSPYRLAVCKKDMEYNNRMQKFRSKLREDAEKLKRHQEKERERDRKRRNIKKMEMDSKALEEKRKRDRERQAKHRENKKKSLNLDKISSTSANGSCKSTRSLKKTVHTVQQHLPQSPSNPNAVLFKVATQALPSDLSMAINNTEAMNYNTISDAVIEKIKQFYMR